MVLMRTLRNSTGYRETSFLYSHPAPQDRMDATRKLIEEKESDSRS